LSTGKSGKYVGVLEIFFDKNSKKPVSYNNKLISITQDIEADPILEKVNSKIFRNADRDTLTTIPPPLKKGTMDGVFAFISDRNGGQNIFLKLLDKNFEYRLTNSDALFSVPKISVSDNSIIYLADVDTSLSTELMIMDITGKNKRTLINSGSVKEASFTADGKWVYAAVSEKNDNHYNILRIRPDGGDASTIISWNDGSEQDISFSLDGQNMLFTSTRDGRNRVYICAINGETPVCISDNDANYYLPKFSPDGYYIAYLSDKNNFNGKRDLWVQEKISGSKIQLTTSAGVEDYCWYYNKDVIIYSSGVNLVDLNTINIKTKENNKLIKNTHPKDYSERNPYLIKWKNSWYILYTREYPDGKKKLFMTGIDGENDKQITIDEGNAWNNQE